MPKRDCRNCFHLRIKIPLGPGKDLLRRRIAYNKATCWCEMENIMMIKRGNKDLEIQIIKNPFHPKQLYKQAEKCVDYDDYDQPI